MKCWKCGAETSVVETRLREQGLTRRRKCANGHRFTSVEVTLDELKLANSAVFKLKEIKRFLSEMEI